MYWQNVCVVNGRNWRVGLMLTCPIPSNEDVPIVQGIITPTVGLLVRQTNAMLATFLVKMYDAV